MNIKERIDEIEVKYWKKVDLACCEQHAHSILSGCFIGKEEDILILQLCYVIRILLGNQQKAKKELSEELCPTLKF